MNFKKRRQDRIIIQISKDFRSIDLNTLKLKKLVKSICNRFKLTEAAISIAVIDDAQSSKLNREFLNRGHATDCLSFDLSESKTNSAKSFDLAVNGEMALREAKLRGHSAEAELALYVTHGLLHNLGFDDSDAGRAKKMHETEDEILQQAGYGLIYNKDIKPPTGRKDIK